MKTLYFNRKTLLGEYYDSFSLKVNVPDDFSLSKEVDEIKEYIHAENELNQKLYFKDIYINQEKEIIIDYEETLDITDKPVLLKIHKTNIDGEYLYSELILDENTNEYITIETINEFNSNGDLNIPILIEVQKETENGEKIFLKPVIETIVEEVFDHTETTTEITDKPVLKPIYIKAIKDIYNHTEYFSIHEVLEKKLENIIETTEYDSICMDIFLDENDLDLNNSFANTGVGILQLPPNGYASTKSIELTGLSKRFELIELDKLPKGINIYINDNQIINNQLELEQAVNSIKISFINTTNKYLDIKSYCIIYKEEDV